LVYIQCQSVVQGLAYKGCNMIGNIRCNITCNISCNIQNVSDVRLPLSTHSISNSLAIFVAIGLPQMYISCILYPLSSLVNLYLYGQIDSLFIFGIFNRQQLFVQNITHFTYCKKITIGDRLQNTSRLQ